MLNNLSKWNDLIEPNTLVSSITASSVFGSIMPIATRLVSRTIGMDLVSVKPMNGVTDEVRNEVKSINRDRKIESLLTDSDYEEMKIQDHPNYGGPSMNLFYLDYKYGKTSSTFGGNTP